MDNETIRKLIRESRKCGRGHKEHSPLMQGNPGGTCPEYGEVFYDEQGQEWERCPSCGRIAKVGYITNEDILTSTQVAQKAVEFMRDHLKMSKMEIK